MSRTHEVPAGASAPRPIDHQRAAALILHTIREDQHAASAVIQGANTLNRLVGLLQALAAESADALAATGIDRRSVSERLERQIDAWAELGQDEP